MSLLVNVLVLAVIIIAILAAVFLFGQQIFPSTITTTQAESLVLSDLQNANPGANLSVTNVTPSQFSGSWHIVVSAVLNATSPCPSYYIYSFDYPKYGFVYRIVNDYASGCSIFVVGNQSTYTLTSYPVAITRSYMLNVSQIKDFVNAYGYYNVSTSAQFFNKTVMAGTTYNDIWLVRYSARKATHSVYAILSEAGGDLLGTYNSTT